MALFAIFVVLFLPGVRATGWDDFSNNLATDLAPIITLFGEQVTKQYLSESLNILDNYIFALAPLGILTALVSAIRVCGSTSLRAFVGRSQEGPGDVERELLSCTSETTAEVWNDGGIARVLGRPKILEVVAFKSEDDDDRAGLAFLGDEAAPWKEQLPYNQHIESGFGSHPPRPNLSINKGIRQLAAGWFKAAACIGTILQTSVLIFAALTVYKFPASFRVDGRAVENYAFPFFFCGTMLVAIGMFLCARLIEKATEERYYKKDHKSKSKIHWLQPGGQKVGDQVFEAFAGDMNQDIYVQSVRARPKERQLSDTSMYLIVACTSIGFIAQFVGYRALHASVTIAQLGATLVMSLIRASLRARRTSGRQNKLDDGDPSLNGQGISSVYWHLRQSLPGHELDWFVFDLLAARVWREQNFLQVKPMVLSSNPAPGAPQSQAKLINGETQELLKKRIRLARLTNGEQLGWDSIPARDTAVQLKFAMERIVEFFAKLPTSRMSGQFSWSIPLEYNEKLNFFEISATRNIGSTWAVDVSVLEAILGLWSWSCLRNVVPARNSKTRYIRLVGPVGPRRLNPDVEQCYRIWIQRRLELFPQETGFSETGPYFRCLTDMDYTMSSVYHEAETPQDFIGFGVETVHSLLTMCAQDVLILFFSSILALNFPDPHSFSGSLEMLRTDNSNGFCLEDSYIEILTDIFEQSQLGSKEDGYMCIVPELMRQSQLPLLKAKLPIIEERVKYARGAEEWEKGIEILEWVCRNTRPDDFTESLCILGEFCLATLCKANAHNRRVAHEAIIRLQDFDKEQQLIEEFRCLAWNVARQRQDDHAMGLFETAKDVFDFKPDLPPKDLIAQNNINTIRYLLATGEMDVTTLCDEPGKQTALHLALRSDRIPLCALLLRQDRIDVNAAEKFLRTPLHLAAQCRSAELAQMLLNNGANVNLQDCNQDTPLFLAARGGDIQVVRLLLSYGANINHKGEHDWTALTWAILRRKGEVVKVLEEAGADLDVGDSWGITPRSLETGIRLAKAREILEEDSLRMG